MSDPIPKLIKYWGGRFRLIIENLPESIRNDKDLHAKVLILVHHKFKNYPWGTMLPEQRLDEINNYVYSLLEEYFN